MSSIHNIPEPTTGYRPVTDEPAPAPAAPMTPGASMRPDCAGQADRSRPDTEIDEEVGGMTWLVVLILSGVVSRVALLYFGALRTLPDAAAAWPARGRVLIEQGPEAIAGSMPVYPLMALGLDTVGVPLGVLAVLQAVLGVLAIAAAYHVGRRLTGRCLAGLGAAALMALHPGVLTWTTAIAPAGLGCSLVAIGLYLLVRTGKDDEPAGAWPAGVTLGIAALTAPAAWLAALGAACWCLAQQNQRQRLARAAIVLALGLGPAFGWAFVSGGGLVPKPTPDALTANEPMPRLAALADHSIDELGAQLRFEIRPNGVLTRIAEGRAAAPAQRDIVADLLGDTWVGLNAALLFAAAVSLALLLTRGRYAAAAVLALPLLVLLASGLPLNEPGRIALLGPLSLLAFGALAARSAPLLTEAEREALAYEKELERQQKIDARHAKRQDKRGIYAFDKPGPPPPTAPAPAPAEPGEALQAGEPEPAMMRPI